MITNYLAAKPSIDAITEAGFIVLVLEVSPEQSLIYTIDTFEPPKTSGIDAIDFGEFKGTDITEYLVSNHTTYVAAAEFIEKFKIMVSNTRKPRISFSNKYRWFKITKL